MGFMVFLFLVTCSSSILVLPTQAETNISLGSSLSPTNSISYWVSESGQFALGFYPYGNGFSIGIWFQNKNIQQRTLVWTANRDDPPFPADSTLLLTVDGRLVVRVRQKQGDQEEETIIADAAPFAASSAAMLDTGNFVLLNSSSGILWQSFDSPTDTILPGQRLLTGQSLFSDVSETNHSRGKFKVIMQNDGNLVQYPVESITPKSAYWATGTFGAGDNVTLNLDPNGQLYLVDTNYTGLIIVLNITNGIRVSGEQVTYRATIDSDGIFRLYSLSISNQSGPGPGGNGNWLTEWVSSDNRCDPKGLCGVNSYCALMDRDPVCQCLPGFDFIDQAHKDLGCRANYTYPGDHVVVCNKNKHSFRELSSLSWEQDSYATLQHISKDDCREECLSDCNCQVSVYTTEDQECQKLKLPLRYGRRGTKGVVTTFVKMMANSTTAIVGPGPGGELKKRRLPMQIFLISGIASLALAFVVLAISGILIYRHRTRQSTRVFLDQRDIRFVEDVTLTSFTYQELKIASSNFTDIIGKGAFGTVFRGVMPNGNRRIVAIKRLERVVAVAQGEREREFRNEMKAIGKTHHKNLVQLLGYCYDGTNRLLVYEYMKNGSLADFLFKSNLNINWQGRMAIIMNIARGIFYLHEECEIQIIHCDIKPENILMDDKGCAKIADFGLAKLLMPNQSKTMTQIRGTRGYVAPEWHRNMPITVKADVYSFGIMLFEIICCRRSVEANVPDDETVLVNWVYDCFKANQVELLLKNNEQVEKAKLERVVKVGLWCTQDEPSSRPSMKKVVLMLEGTVKIADPPCPSSLVRSSSSYRSYKS